MPEPLISIQFDGSTSGRIRDDPAPFVVVEARFWVDPHSRKVEVHLRRAGNPDLTMVRLDFTDTSDLQALVEALTLALDTLKERTQ